MTARRTAAQSYRSIEHSSAVLAATAHELVSILYDRIAQEIETMLASSRCNAVATFRTSQIKVLELLQGLSEGVDRRSGDIAVHLIAVYRAMIDSAGRARCGEDMGELTETLLTVRQLDDAWRTIG